MLTPPSHAFAPWFPCKVPALYLSSYSRLQGVSDDLMLVRPDPSYRWEKDERCQHALSDEHAVYMVYTIEEGEDRWVSRVVGRKVLKGVWGNVFEAEKA